jgi:nucleotide-binding universal stress UspA family protein
MLTLKQIVVPVDFSERCLAAARHAVCLGKRFNAALTFTHVIDRSLYQPVEMEGLFGESFESLSFEKWESRLTEKLHEFTAKVARDVPVEEVVLKGDPAREIENLVQRKQAGLVVIPTHGSGVFRKFLLGSVAGKILHDVSCPVFSGAHVQEAPFETMPYHRVGCALDLANGSEQVLRWAGEFAQAWGAELVVIHATPFMAVQADEVYIAAVDWRDMIVKRAEGQARELLKKLGYQAELCVEEGHPVHFVASAAADQKLDVLVIGRGLAARRASRLPSHAYGIIRESPCPVISLP